MKLLDENQSKSAVLAISMDWASAFDRQDPTIAIQKFIKLGIRPSLIPILVSYLTDRKMRVRFNEETSNLYKLIGGGPQGTLMGGIEYIVQSDDNANIVHVDDRFKYIDDLSVLELILLSGILTDYNFQDHIASDIGIDQKFLPPTSINSQSIIDHISNWTIENKMKLNEKKCNYMIFTRSQYDFVTRLEVNNTQLDRTSASKILGVWVTEDLTWSRNCAEICKKAYSRLSLITKLKYAGVSTENLIEIFILFVRSLTEYCAVAFHSSLTQEDSNKLEQIQKTCLKVILGDMYISYSAALEMCNLKPLSSRRQDRCLAFAQKCLKHKRNNRLFPLRKTSESDNHDIRTREKFKVNFAKGETYRKSAIPYCQRLLNNQNINTK